MIRSAGTVDGQKALVSTLHTNGQFCLLVKVGMVAGWPGLVSRSGSGCYMRNEKWESFAVRAVVIRGYVWLCDVSVLC